jgi:hypothetical protein
LWLDSRVVTGPFGPVPQSRWGAGLNPLFVMFVVMPE